MILKFMKIILMSCTTNNVIIRISRIPSINFNLKPVLLSNYWDTLSNIFSLTLFMMQTYLFRLISLITDRIIEILSSLKMSPDNENRDSAFSLSS